MPLNSGIRSLMRISAGLVAFWVAVTGAVLLTGRFLPLGQGTIVFQSDRSGVWNLYLLDLTTGLAHALAPATYEQHGPSWSPDGEQIMFHADSDGDGFSELYLMSWNGRDLRQLTEKPGSLWRASWSPDGTQIVYMFGYQDIRVMDLESLSELPLVVGFSPMWSPDGDQIAFYDDPDGRLSGDVYVVNRDGRGRRNLTAHPANDWAPSWSPDGRWLAFTSTRDGSAEIYVMDATCVETTIHVCRDSVRRLTDHPASDGAPTFSPNGREIAFVSDRDGRGEIYVVAVEGGSPRRVTYGGGQFPAWRPR